MPYLSFSTPYHSMTKLTQVTLGLWAALFLSFGGASTAHAQQAASETMDDTSVSNTERWYFHAHLAAHSQSIANQDDLDAGGGLGIRVGYGVSPLVTLYLGLDGASMSSEDDVSQSFFGDEYTLGVVEIGAQFNFRRDKKLVPYFDAALIGAASVVDEDGREASIEGGGIGIGGGVKYFVSPEFALDGGLYTTMGSYDEQEVNGDTQDIGASFGMGRFIVGISWYPFR